MIAKFDERLRAVPHAELELGQLTRNTEVLSKMYSFLLERQEQAMVAKAANISRNHILDNPAIPTREDSPVLPVRLALGLVVGLFVGLAAAVLRWATRQTFQTDADVRRDLGPLAVFASVPRQPLDRDTGARGAVASGGRRSRLTTRPPRSPRRSGTCARTSTTRTSRTAHKCCCSRHLARATARLFVPCSSPVPWRPTASGCW